MTNVFRIQGFAFSLGSIVLIPAAIAMHGLETRAQLLILAFAIVILGVPHGALDIIFAKRAYKIHTPIMWAAFTVFYFIPIAAVVMLWAAAPVAFLAGFLLISMFHFSGDPEPETPFPIRGLYGGAIIILPLALHSNEVRMLFSLLAGPAASSDLLYFLDPLAWPWLFCLIAAALFETRRDMYAASELMAVTLLALFAPPLSAFTIFFCGMHSARHILRTITYFGPEHWRNLLAAAGLPIFAILGMFVAALFWPSGLSVDRKVIQFLFVGLAALTVPHMAIIERVRLSGWKPTASSNL